YNREDFWEIPTEKYFNEDQEMEPYYVTMNIDEKKNEEEFVLMTPFTPKKRQNMISWMGVRNEEIIMVKCSFINILNKRIFMDRNKLKIELTKIVQFQKN